MTLKNVNTNMTDSGNTPGQRMGRVKAPGEGLTEARKAVKSALPKARAIGRQPMPTPAQPAQPITRPATPARPRKPSAGLNPVKPVTQTQGRKKNDPWNSPW